MNSAISLRLKKPGYMWKPFRLAWGLSCQKKYGETEYCLSAIPGTSKMRKIDEALAGASDELTSKSIRAVQRLFCRPFDERSPGDCAGLVSLLYRNSNAQIP